MRKLNPILLVYAILFLFIIQMTGTLVQSIYVLDLMNLSLDEKVLGLLFFFGPIFLMAVRKKIPAWLIWGSAGLLSVSRGLTPYLNTQNRMLASGISTTCALILLGLLVAAKPKRETSSRPGWDLSGGLALAICFSILLRTLNFSIDYSLTVPGAWVGWLLGLTLLGMLSLLDWQRGISQPAQQNRPTLPVLGIFMVLILAYFSFSAPVVIARWTAGSYPWIVGAVSFWSAAWAWVAIRPPRWLENLSRRLLVTWNLAFSLSLVATTLIQRISFPQTPGSIVVVNDPPALYVFVPLVLMLLLFPVVWIDLRLFGSQVNQQASAPADLVPGFLLGSAALVLLVFMNIFTNVWGYISPVSNLFRNLFWLPFLLICGGLTLLVAFQKEKAVETPRNQNGYSWGWTALLVLLFAASTAEAFRSIPVHPIRANPTSLVVMTYNIQAGNDQDAEPAYDRQLALIRQVSPDILALQETDTARISLNNNDPVLYFANQLGYYFYYGPATVTGTYGTAILSKYPLQNTGVIFSYSDTDEIGTTRAEIEVADRRFTIFDVHPDGSDTAKVAFAKMLLSLTQGKTNVIAMGDYNSRKTDPAYLLISTKMTNAWTSVYPSEISTDGTDMSGRDRIDHIFLSPELKARNPKYILPPASATDHPVHWAEIFWEP
jgi:endonuclease/exonuclease/phosphatase family metal-dependent hydrolase